MTSCSSCPRNENSRHLSARERNSVPGARHQLFVHRARLGFGLAALGLRRSFENDAQGHNPLVVLRQSKRLLGRRWGALLIHTQGSQLWLGTGRGEMRHDIQRFLPEVLDQSDFKRDRTTL